MEEELVISIMEKNERICRLEERHIEANGELVRARSELKEPVKKHPELWSCGAGDFEVEKEPDNHFGATMLLRFSQR